MARMRLPANLVRRNVPHSTSSSSDDVKMDWRTLVGRTRTAKRSAPTRLNSRPLKKKKKFHLNPTHDQNSQNYSCTEQFEHSWSQSHHNTADNICLAMADNFNLIDSGPKNMISEEVKNMQEENSEVESPVDQWACRVCKKAAVAIAVLPCRHLCLCWDCEAETDKCPVCGNSKEEVFYIRT